MGGWLISRVRGVTLERWNVNAMVDLYWPYLWKSGNGNVRKKCMGEGRGFSV